MDDEGRIALLITEDSLGQIMLIFWKECITFFITRFLSEGLYIFIGIDIYFFNWESI